MSRHRVSARVHGPLSRLAWFLWYVAVLLIPLFLTWGVIGPPDTSPGGSLVLSAGLVGFSALVVAVALPARLPWLIAAFGIETVLAVHRAIALIAVVLVVVHLVAVLFVDPRGLSILAVWHTTWAARAAITSTVALVLVVVLALRRPGRQPRYEGWRLVHNGLVAVVLVTAWLHVWWLRHLVSHVVMAAWFVVSGLVLAGLAARRWIWLPLRSRKHAYVVVSVGAVAGDGVTLVIQADGHPGLAFEAGQFVWARRSDRRRSCSRSIRSASPRRPNTRTGWTSPSRPSATSPSCSARSGRAATCSSTGRTAGSPSRDSTTRPGSCSSAPASASRPLLSMLRTLADRGDRRRFWLITSARTQHDLMLRPEVEQVRTRLNLKVVEVVSAPGPGWTGETGRIDHGCSAANLPRRPHRLHYFLCGPQPMVTSVSHDLAALGVPYRRIHTERFGSV